MNVGIFYGVKLTHFFCVKRLTFTQEFVFMVNIFMINLRSANLPI